MKVFYLTELCWPCCNDWWELRDASWECWWWSWRWWWPRELSRGDPLLLAESWLSRWWDEDTDELSWPEDVELTSRVGVVTCPLPRVDQDVSILSRSVICCLRKRILCSCSVACISASLTRDLAILRSADTWHKIQSWDDDHGCIE